MQKRGQASELLPSKSCRFKRQTTLLRPFPLQIDLKILDEADFPLVFGRKGSLAINTLDTSPHDSQTHEVAENPVVLLLKRWSTWSDSALPAITSHCKLF